MSLAQLGLLLDAIGVALVYFFVFDLPIDDEGNPTSRIIHTPEDGEANYNPNIIRFHNLYRPHIFKWIPEHYKLILSDLGLAFLLAGFGAQIIAAN